MKIAVIISEYNPFHNGHKYQIDMLKKKYDSVIAIMSGNFVQRGDIAVCDKWTRAKAALINGIDLVIELPVIYALNSAERFARGAVKIAHELGVAESLCFGSECGNIEEIESAAEILNNEPEEVSERIAKYIKEGMSYPSARALAYEEIINPELLSGSNNILGIEYVRALKKIDSAIRPETIKRIGAGYNEIGYDGIFNSASGIRKLIKNSEDYRKYMPKTAWEIFNKASKFSAEGLTDILKYSIISRGKEYIAGINDVAEGLENKIYDAARLGGTFEETADLIKSKRYTMSRVRRILFSVILGIDKDIAGREPEYIRVLGMNRTGMKILKKMKERAGLPVVVKTADFSSPILDLDIFATDIAYMTLKNHGIMGRDYLTSPVII